ncbi:hypothetical protein RHOER0001_4589 [Rhodococcus erythropolis SK121]|nr:hypothetical protein RHOER0001_4589 [Rhodococcus erythropolis SK121]
MVCDKFWFEDRSWAHMVRRAEFWSSIGRSGALEDEIGF